MEVILSGYTHLSGYIALIHFGYASLIIKTSEELIVQLMFSTWSSDA